MLKSFTSVFQQATFNIAILGMPYSGKSYFIASLYEWLLTKIDSDIFIEGRGHLNALRGSYARLDFDVQQRIITPSNSKIIKTEHKPKPIVMQLPAGLFSHESVDIRIHDSEGEIIKNTGVEDKLHDFNTVVKNNHAIILTVDFFGDEPVSTFKEHQDNDLRRGYLDSIDRLNQAFEEDKRNHNSKKKLAIVITKADRIFAFEDLYGSRYNVLEQIRQEIKDYYRPFSLHADLEVFTHSAVGMKPNRAYSETQSYIKPIAYGLEDIFQFLLSNVDG